MIFFKKSMIVNAFLILLAVAITTPAQAEFPERTVTFYIMHKPGGGTDTGFRAFLPFFEKHLGGKVAAVNKTGAGGAKMLNFLARAKPDGYTIGSTNLPNFPVNLVIRKDLHFTIDSFDHIGAIAIDPTSIYVRADSKYKNFNDLITDAKNNPGMVTIGVPNFRNHGLTLLRAEQALGVDFNLVVLGGGGPTRKAVLGDHVPVGTQSIGAVMRFHPNKIRVLVQFAPKRVAHALDVPTISELTDAKVYHNVVRMAGAPKGIPEKTLAKLRNAWKAAMEDPAWLKTAKELDMPSDFVSGEDADKMAKDMYKELKDLFASDPALMKLTKK